MKCECGRSHKSKADRAWAHEVKRLRQERDLYRARAIDEVLDHHEGATPETAGLDVDLEAKRQMMQLRGMVAALLAIGMLALSGCKGLDRLVTKGGKDKDPHEMFIVACCQDNNNGTLSFPASVPTEHAQFCRNVSQACFTNDCQIGNDTHIPMSVDCGNHHGYIGDQYYPEGVY